jgi:hypothetical protein
VTILSGFLGTAPGGGEMGPALEDLGESECNAPDADKNNQCKGVDIKYPADDEYTAIQIEDAKFDESDSGCRQNQDN